MIVIRNPVSQLSFLLEHQLASITKHQLQPHNMSSSSMMALALWFGVPPLLMSFRLQVHSQGAATSSQAKFDLSLLSTFSNSTQDHTAALFQGYNDRTDADMLPGFL